MGGQAERNGGSSEAFRREDEPVSETVLRALTAAGVDIMNADTVLYDTVDLDALNRLFSRSVLTGVTADDRYVEFVAFDRHVRVYGDARVVVESLED